MTLACLFLGERMNRGRWVALTCGFLGVLVMVRPGLESISGGALVMLACASLWRQGARGMVEQVVNPVHVH